MGIDAQDDVAATSSGDTSELCETHPVAQMTPEHSGEEGSVEQ